MPAPGSRKVTSASTAARLLALVLAAAALVAHLAARADAAAAWREAITHRDAAALARLLDEGVDVDLANDAGVTALMVAAGRGDLALARRLLDVGARVDATNARGGTALMYAAQGGNVRLLKLLLARGAEAGTIADNGWTALTIAAAKGHVRMVRILLERGVDPNARDIYGWTALMRATQNAEAEVVDALLEAEGIALDTRNEHGMTALHLAAVAGDRAIATRLLRHCADPTIEDEAGRTPAALAEEAGHLRLARRLREADEIKRCGA